MLLRSETHNQRIHDVTTAIIKLVCTEGIGAVTMRRVADTNRMSLGGLCAHVSSRRKMLLAGAQNLAARRQARFEERFEREGWPALLPADESDIWLERAWLAWRTWARSDEGLDGLLDQLEVPQHRALVETLMPPGGPPEDRAQQWALQHRYEAAWAAITGLRDQLCRPGAEEFDAARAQAALGILLAPGEATAKPAGEGDSLTP